MKSRLRSTHKDIVVSSHHESAVIRHVSVPSAQTVPSCAARLRPLSDPILIRRVYNEVANHLSERVEQSDQGACQAHTRYEL